MEGTVKTVKLDRGFAFVSRPGGEAVEVAERIAICRTCELYKGDQVNGVCTHESCGCPVNDSMKVVSKLAWRDHDCPLGKWPKLDEKAAR
jgi:hypothetical protein